MVNNLPANDGDIRDTGSIPVSGRFPGVGHGSPLKYSCLENPTDKGAWWAIDHRVAKKWDMTEVTSRTHTHTHTHKLYNIVEDQT